MFWTNFEYLCKNAGVSPNSVAAAMKKSSGSVTAWKNGIVPRRGTINEIAEYFGVNADDLLKVDLQKTNKPTLENEDELDRLFKNELSDLTPSELAKVHAFVAGLKASRMP